MKLHGVLLVCVLTFQQAFGCTTFLLEAPAGPYFGKSYDWDQDHGALLVNPKGMHKVALGLRPGDKPHAWDSTYGSITFNQVARELPLAGINEAGLVVEIMVVGSQDPDPDERPTVNELQWIQLQLDSYATVKEVMENVDKVRISRIQANVHYLICDATSVCGAVEVLGKKFVKPWGEELPVKALANHPYATSLGYSKKFKGFGGDLPMPTTSFSTDRFVRAAMLAKSFNPAGTESAEQKAFSILESVKQDHSQWNVVYDIREREVAYRNVGTTEVRRASLKSADFTCKKEILGRDFKSDGNFTAFTAAKNRELLETTSSKHPLSGPAIEAILKYPESDSLKCL